jgi:acyl-CoA synthetase (NDP forming)
MLDTVTVMAAARRRPPAGWRTVIVSGLGGECGRVADAADRAGIELPQLAPETVRRIGSFMPEFANPRNPLDGTGAMYEDASLFPRLIDSVLADEGAEILAVNLGAKVPKPGGWAPNRNFATAVAEKVSAGADRFVVAFNSFVGGDLDQDVVRPLAAAGVPFLEGTDTAMLALRHLREHREFVEDAARRPPPAPVTAPHAYSTAGLHGVLRAEWAQRLLTDYGIPLVETVSAKDVEAAVDVAERLGYPVVLKVDSPQIVHKTDVGGVRVGLASAADVRRAGAEMLAEVRRRAPAARIDGVLVQPLVGGGTEMIVGVKSDPLVGPAVVCGFGGVFVEVMRDVAVRVPPFDADEAREMIASLRGAALLAGARGRPAADVDALVDVLVKVAAFAEANGASLRAMDLNPVLVREAGRGVAVVDWLVELA